MLKIDLKPGESLVIGSGKNAVTVTMDEKKGQVARLSFEADKSVPINRSPKDKVARIAAQSGISGAKS